MTEAKNRVPYQNRQNDINLSGDRSILYRVREVVAVFQNEDELESAVEELLLSGFDRRQISVLASEDKKRKIGDFAATGVSAAHLEDDPRAPLGNFVSPHSRAEIEAASIGLPGYLLGVGGYVAVVAVGGSLAFAIAALLMAGAAGAGLGGFLAHTIERHHHHAIAAQMDKGGLLLWVRARSPALEHTAIAILESHHGRDVHVHDIERSWSIEDVPFHDAQPDPLLVDRP